MRICITSKGKDLDSQLDPRFGRCKFFIILDTGSGKVESLDNPYMEASGGAGLKAAELVSKYGIKALITGNVGPNAFNALSAMGIKVYGSPASTIKEALANFKQNKLKEISGPSGPEHMGMG